jgi:uncharacterized membrane protein (DUF485 family)
VVISPMSTETPAPAGAESPAPAGAETPAPAGAEVKANGNQKYVDVAQSPEFDQLRRTLRNFVFPLTAAFLLWYALYVLLSAYARGFMSTKVVGHINIALIFGLLQFLSTFLIAWAYARYADRKIDPLADELRARVENGGDQS